MIVWRIYRVAKNSEGSTSVHQLEFVMRILIESGFLYLAVSIAHFISWWTPDAYAISIIAGIVSFLSAIIFENYLMNISPIAEPIGYWDCI